MINDELLTLRNLGKTSAQWLHATGIHSRDDLLQRGPVGAYCAVRARGFRASKSLMFAIAGALEDVHWNQLPAEYKQQLLKQLKEHETPGPPREI